MLRASLIIAWLVCSSVTSEPIFSYSTPVFGARVSIGANSQITTYACFLYNGRVLTKKRILDRETFIKFLSGHWPSIYNPSRINHFELNNVPGGIEIDSATTDEFAFCPSLDSLWKIRYTTYPFRNGVGRGWSNKFMKPSPKQEIHLNERYGVGHIDSDFFLDTSFWKLLTDVRDTTWIQSYRLLR